ncbi:MAG: 4-alpha-glucanotransferase [Anaerolineales bacterium]|nr:4-alpha-glucanotransferase [Anaerolineales bacterium]MCX7609907.1 4-alpha-glucanotransferase [Anaerolineales bacterium]
MKFERSSGILLHPTSLPGPYGIGDLGPAAYRWIDWLAGTGCKLWQILPLGPTGYGDSPYQCFSAFAGNPYLVSFDFIVQEGWLTQDDLVTMPTWDPQKVDFGRLFQWKPALLEKAYRHFVAHPGPARARFESFCAENAFWLEDYALFMALKEAHGGGSWDTWPEELRRRQPDALSRARRELSEVIGRVSFVQFLFFEQWQALRQYTHQRGIKIIGDIPIFVAYDSADVWAHPELFYLDERGKPSVVAGVPPDYFSPTGQLWGNPLYRWDVHKSDGYTWWLDRIRFTLQAVDIVRIDHFRGFAGYWEIPGEAENAIHGRWVPGPGADFFQAVQERLGDLPIIAEDLGEITPDVIALRDQFHLPGMKILQFAFSGPENPFLPHHFVPNSVVYTGTHDNDTTRGWFETIGTAEREFASRYFQRDWADSREFTWHLIRTAWASVAVFALAPMQDFLTLGSEARFNYPSRLGGNWAWRMLDNALTPELQARIRELNWLYSR